MISEERLWELNKQTMNGPWVDPISFARAVEAEAYEAALRSLPEHGVGHYLYEKALTDCAAAIRQLKETS